MQTEEILKCYITPAREIGIKVHYFTRLISCTLYCVDGHFARDTVVLNTSSLKRKHSTVRAGIHSQHKHSVEKTAYTERVDISCCVGSKLLTEPKINALLLLCLLLCVCFLRS